MNVCFSFLLLLLLLCIILITCECKISCLNEKGEEVDWFYAHKTPQITKGNDPGYNLLYFDSTHPSSWVQFDLLKDDSNPVAKTIQQMYFGNYSSSRVSDSLAWVLYNDQTYDSQENITNHRAVDHYLNKGFITGHTKGHVVFDESSAYWMVHSTPGFPLSHSLSPQKWTFLEPQSVFGQNFFCVSISASSVETVASVIEYNFPYVYDFNIPSSWESKFPSTSQLVKNEYKKGHTSAQIKSVGGLDVTIFSKAGEMDADVYEDYLAPDIKSGLKVQSWCGGPWGFNCEPSYCQGQPILNASTPQQGESTYGYNSVNIMKLSFSEELWWENKFDHAKFAISYDGKTPWICATDNNRALSQRKRGGGGACFQSEALWEKLNNIITGFDKKCTTA